MKQRALRDEERRPVLRALMDSKIASDRICRKAVDGVRFIPFAPFLPPLTRGIRPVVAYLALRRRASGIALGDQVYIRRNLFGRHGQLPLDLITHEAAHVAQFIRDGTASFLLRYVAEYLSGRLRGLGDRSAYLQISYEQEARLVESFLPDDSSSEQSKYRSR